MVDCVLVDWGTSNFRLWGVDEQFDIVCTRQSAAGMAKLKREEFEPFLEETLMELSVGTSVPVLICGMAGAAQGWQDAGYVDVPCNPLNVAQQAIRAETATNRDVRILPGLACRATDTPDVMRGEETLLLAAMQSENVAKIFCIPGTHSKWVFTAREAITSFTTFMTGELFALLSEQSVLSPYLTNDNKGTFDPEVFGQAVSDTLANPEIGTEQLFKLRAGGVLGDGKSNDTRRARLSGLLIGLELAAIRDRITDPVCLIADGIHKETYSIAFNVAGIEFRTKNSRELAFAGLVYAAKKIWGER